MTQNLKIEVLTGDISIDGMVVTNLVTKEELSTAIVKKADLGTDGKIPTSQLPAEIVNTAGIVDEVKLQLETSIKDAVDESNAYAESYTDNAMTSKADLESGKVPLEQLPVIDQYPQFGTALSNLSTSILSTTKQRTDQLEKTKADLGEDGKVLREQIPSYEKISGLPEQLEVMSTQTAAVSGELDQHKLQTADQIDTLKENINSNSEFLIETMDGRLENYADKGAVKRGIANRYDSSLAYNSGERVVVANGNIVKSTIDGNVNDPNVDMIGWIEDNSASQIFDKSGLSQQEINDRQKLKNDNLKSVKDYGAIGDGSLHTVNEWTVLGSKIYYPSLAAMQVDYPHVTSLTDSVDWAAAQKSINDTKIAYYPKSSGAYINNKTLQLNGYWDSVVGASKQVVIKNIGSGLPALRLTKSFQTIRNISIWGDGGGFGVGATTGHGIHLDNGTSTNFHDVCIRYHGGHGVYGSGGVWITKIVQCYIEHNLQDGINIVSPSGATFDQIGNALSITESVIALNTGNGLNWKAVALNVTGSVIEGNKGFGILVDTTPYTSSVFGVNITGNYTENNVLGEIKFKCKTAAIVTDINIVGNYFYSIQTGGAVAAITFEGEYRTFRNVNICSNGLVTGGRVVNLVDGGNSLREDCTINLGAYSGINLARAKLVSGIKSKVIFGKAHCIGANWVDLYTSENIFSATAKTLYFDLPLESGVALDKVEFLMSTNATNQYNIIATLYRTDPLTNAAPIDVYSATLLSDVAGGDKVFAFTTLQSNNAVRLALGVRYHLRFVISAMTTGSIVTIGNPIARYI